MSRHFAYELLLSDGASHWGVSVLPVEQERSAREWLERRHDAVVIHLYALPRSMSALLTGGGRLSRHHLRQDMLAALLRDIAVMTTAGIPVIDALEAVRKDTDEASAKAMRGVCTQLLEDLNAGANLSGAFAKQPHVFPDTVRSLAVIGDETGNMHTMLMEAAEHVDRLRKMKSAAKQAMIYPAFSFLAIFGAAGFWVVYVMPKLIDLFKQMNAKLPPFTIMVLQGTDWLTRNALSLLAVLVLLAVVLPLGWRMSLRLRRVGYALLHRAPISKTVLTSSGLAFIAEYLSILLHAGVDVITSMNIIEKSVSDLYYKERIAKMREHLAQGLGFSFAIREVGGFPSLMTRMITVGEESGTLDRQLGYLAQEYSRRLQLVVSTISEIVKPMIIVFAGAIFLVMIVAFLLPVYDLVKQTMGGMR